MWYPVDSPWQYRVLDALPPGIDEAQLERARRMTPSERVDAVVAIMETAEALQRAMAKKREAR